MILPTDNNADLAGCDLVIEAVFENMAVKKEIFTTLDAACGPDTILASNTSSFPIREMGAASGRPSRSRVSTWWRWMWPASTAAMAQPRRRRSRAAISSVTA